MSKDIWHKPSEKPEPFKTFVFKTDKGNTCSDMLSTNCDWNTMLLPEFYSMEDIDKAERITEWAYLDDLLALETELERMRKALEIAVDALKEIEHYTLEQELQGICTKSLIAEQALEQITAWEQKE